MAGFEVKDLFPVVRKMVEMPAGEQFSRGFPDVGKTPHLDFPDVRKTKKDIDYNLSRYACYLIVQNGDPRRENIKNKELASYAHFTVGKEVREAIIRLGGVMPEELPTPQKGIIELEREAIKKLKEKNKEIMTDE